MPLFAVERDLSQVPPEDFRANLPGLVPPVTPMVRIPVNGVEMAQWQAKQALEAERVDQARTLLQDSIKQALADVPAATGEVTGTKLVLLPMPGRDGLAGRDWFFLGASIALLLTGLGLASRYRPADTIGDLRLLLVGPTARHQARRT